MALIIDLMVQVAVSVVVFVFCAAIVRAFERRGFFPVESIARVLSPDTVVASGDEPTEPAEEV